MIDCGDDPNCNKNTETRHLISNQSVSKTIQTPSGSEIFKDIISFDIVSSDKIGFTNMTITGTRKVSNIPFKIIMEL